MTARRLRELAARLVPPLCAALALLAFWELWVRWTDPPRFLFCAPSEIWRDATARAGELGMATWKTTIAVVWGFALSAVVGVAAGVILSSSRLLERALYPFTVILQTVPLVAIAPMLVIWLHAGVQAVSICAFIVSLFPVITNTLSGIRSIPQPQVELFRMYGARPWAVLFKLKLPGAIPSIMAGLRIAAGLSVIGAVVGEFVAGELGADRGLGIVVVVAAKQGELPMLFAAVVLASLLGIVMVGGVNAVAYLLMHRWHVSQRPD
ncbi:MAG TPA: ABC transporter permease [Kofleriaceae bacterium]|nr:ABC transporter permease [Kofleriaceae bacterium]